MKSIFSEYLIYRAQSRGFDLAKIDEILSYSSERYFDTETYRHIAVGKHEGVLVMIPYEQVADQIIPATIHSTTRQQIKFRLQTGRFIHE
jgi:hypothetical protein